MTQPSAPILTPVVGIPATITTRTGLRGQATFDSPYLGGPVGAGVGSVPFEWDAANNRWKNSNTDGPLELPLARGDVLAAAKPHGWLYIDLTWTDEAGRRQSEQLRFRPAAGEDGTLDLTRDQDPEAYTTTASLQALTADAEQAAAAANTAAGRVNDAILDLSAERQAVADIIADTAQSAAEAETAAGEARAAIANVADVTVTAGQEETGPLASAVWQGTASNVRGWGFAVGVRRNVKRIRIPVRHEWFGDGTATITVTLRAAGPTGAVLGQATQNVNFARLTDNLIDVTFATPANPDGAETWLEWMTSAAAGYGYKRLETSPYPVPPYPSPRYYSTGAAAWLNQSERYTPYVLIDTEAVTFALKGGMANEVERIVTDHLDDTLPGLQAGAAVGERVGSITVIPPVNEVRDEIGSVATGTWVETANSGVKGWGFPLSAATNINRVEWYVRQSTALYNAKAITQIQARLRSGGPAGSLIDQAIIPVATVADQANLVRWDLSATHPNGAAALLWLEYVALAADGTPANTGYLSVPVEATTPQSRYYHVTNNDNAGSGTAMGTHANAYAKLSLVSAGSNTLALTAEMEALVRRAAPGSGGGSGPGTIIINGGGGSREFAGLPNRALDIPRFVRHNANPIFSDLQAGTASIYWCWVDRVDGVLANPINKYYMWYSTDHDATVGGIYLATAPTPLGPWTQYGRVFVDTVQGSQTETPSVVWDELNSHFVMYYQQIGGGIGAQSTRWATSPDGVTWTRGQVAIQMPNGTDFAGDGHTGYFVPFRVGDLWAAFSLCGSGNYGRFGLSYSYDGYNWELDPRVLGYTAESLRQPGYLPHRNHSVPISWNGQMWVVARIANHASGSTPVTARLAIARLSHDLRQVLGPWRDVIVPIVNGNSWESANVRAHTVFSESGKLYLYYQCDNRLGVAVAGGEA